MGFKKSSTHKSPKRFRRTKMEIAMKMSNEECYLYRVGKHPEEYKIL